MIAHSVGPSPEPASMNTAAFVILVWVVNFGISIWNAYAVGKAWVETKYSGGWPRFVAWAGAVMSASGFSWCYLIILTYAAYQLGWLDNGHVSMAMSLGYILLIPAVLTSGMVITLDSWARTYRRTSLMNMGRTAWNSYAQLHNSFHVIGDMDTAFGNVIDGLSIKGSGSSDKKGGAVVFILVFVLVMLALISGVLTTAVIISRVAGTTPLPEDPNTLPTEEPAPKRVDATEQNEN